LVCRASDNHPIDKDARDALSHNRVTMMEVEVIYGVSMGSDSVSRVLSLKLEEAPVAEDR
jgi:hypothetical protein